MTDAIDGVSSLHNSFVENNQVEDKLINDKSPLCKAESVSEMIYWKDVELEQNDIIEFEWETYWEKLIDRNNKIKDLMTYSLNHTKENICIAANILENEIDDVLFMYTNDWKNYIRTSFDNIKIKDPQKAKVTLARKKYPVIILDQNESLYN